MDERKDFQKLVAASNDFQAVIFGLESGLLIDPFHLETLSLKPSELDDLIQQHSDLIDQADAYQLGDLESLRSECKDAASSKTMTQQDTDIVELALSALTVLDKGRHLIRQRSKMLDLVSLRMKWEEQKALVAKELTALSQDVNKFVSKARWVLPEDAPARRRRISMQAKTVKSPLRNMVANGRLAAPAEASPLGGGSTSSIMARRMRLDILNLDLARNTQRIHSLSQASIVNLGKTLDKFIDTSTTRLPDAFLDCQEGLENKISDLTSGLSTFLSAMVKQWKTADEAYWLSEEIDQEADAIQREITAELVKRPSLRNSKVYRDQLVKLSDKLSVGRRKIDVELPLPIHAHFDEQQEANVRLKALLLKCLDKAARSVTSLEDAAKAYATSAAAVDRIGSLKAAMEACNAALDSVQRTALGFRNALPELKIDSRILLDPVLDGQLESLRVSSAAEAEIASALIQQAGTCLVDIQTLRIDPNLQQGLRDAWKAVKDAQSSISRTVADAELAHKQRVVLSQFVKKAVILNESMCSICSSLRDDFKRFKRKAGDNFVSIPSNKADFHSLENGLAILKSLADSLSELTAPEVTIANQLRQHLEEAFLILPKLASLAEAVGATARQSAAFQEHFEALRHLQRSIARVQEDTQDNATCSTLQESFAHLKQQQSMLPFLGRAFDDVLGEALLELGPNLAYRKGTPFEFLETNDETLREEITLLTVDVSSQLAKLQRSVDAHESARLLKEADTLMLHLEDRSSSHYEAFLSLQPRIQQAMKVEESSDVAFIGQLATQLDHLRMAKQSEEADFGTSLDRLDSIWTEIARVHEDTGNELLDVLQQRQFHVKSEWAGLQSQLYETVKQVSSRDAFLSAKLEAEAAAAQEEQAARLKAASEVWQRARAIFEEHKQQAHKHLIEWQSELDEFSAQATICEASRNIVVVVNSDEDIWQDLIARDQAHSRLEQFANTTHVLSVLLHRCTRSMREVLDIDQLPLQLIAAQDAFDGYSQDLSDLDARTKIMFATSSSLLQQVRSSLEEISSRIRQEAIASERALARQLRALRVQELSCQIEVLLSGFITPLTEASDDSEDELAALLSQIDDRLGASSQCSALIEDLAALSEREDVPDLTLVDDHRKTLAASNVFLAKQRVLVLSRLSDLKQKLAEERELQGDARRIRESQAAERARFQTEYTSLEAALVETDALSTSMWRDWCESLQDVSSRSLLSSQLEEIRKRSSHLETRYHKLAGSSFFDISGLNVLLEAIRTSSNRMALALHEAEVTAVSRQSIQVQEIQEILATLTKRAASEALPTKSEVDWLVDQARSAVNKASDLQDQRLLLDAVRAAITDLEAYSLDADKCRMGQAKLSSIIDSIDLFGTSRSAVQLQDELLACTNLISLLLAQPVRFNGIGLQTELLSRGLREATELVSDTLAASKIPKKDVRSTSSTIPIKTRIPVRLSLQPSDANRRSVSRSSMVSSTSHRSITPTPTRGTIKLPAFQPRRFPMARQSSASEIGISAKRQIDVAIGDIISKLSKEGHRHANIKAADGKSSPNDTSGRFLIGGRLYFCRILRSTAVYVRVGGGWEALDTFLRSHFVHDENGQLTRSVSSQMSLSSIASPAIARSLSASFRATTPDGENDLTSSQVLHTLHQESVKASPPSLLRWQ